MKETYKTHNPIRPLDAIRALQALLISDLEHSIMSPNHQNHDTVDELLATLKKYSVLLLYAPKPFTRDILFAIKDPCFSLHGVKLQISHLRKVIAGIRHKTMDAGISQAIHNADRQEPDNKRLKC